MARFDPAWPQTMYGAPALDFVNTLDWRGRAESAENLKSYLDLVRFAVAAGAIDRPAASRAAAWADAHPRAATRALAEAIRLREGIAAVFQSLARGRAVPQAALAVLEEFCRNAWSGRALEVTREGAAWKWRSGDGESTRPAGALALDAERLLLDDDRAPVRECEGEGCGWLFLDTSRNHSRRWCSMESCGNRAKAKRFYRKARAAAARP